MPSKYARPQKKVQKPQAHAEQSLSQTKPATALWLGVGLVLIALVIFAMNGMTDFFWLTFVLGALILLPNYVWQKLGWGHTFIFPHILLMLKTKKFITFIENVAHKAKLLEWIAYIGIFFGFGLVAVDYFYARKLGGIKRILLLIISALALGAFFHVFLTILFKIPLLAPLYVISLIGFIVLGFGGLTFAILIGYGLLAVISLFTQKQICPNIAPVIPGVPIPGVGFMVPLVAWVSLALILIIHELSHGLLMSRFSEKIKSVGLLMAGVFPVGAFVEQDDTTFEKLADKKKLLVLSAGPASNLVTILIGFVLLNLFFIGVSPLAENINAEFSKTYAGVQINGVEQTISFCGVDRNAPAYGKIFTKDKVVSLNGTPITDINSLNYEFAKSSDYNFILLRDGNEVAVQVTPTVFEDLNIRRIGVVFGGIPSGYEPPLLTNLLSMIINAIATIITFLIVLSFAAGMFNYMPSDPLDGGKMGKIMLAPYFGFMHFKSEEETRTFIGRIAIWLFAVALVLNLIPYVTMLFKFI